MSLALRCADVDTAFDSVATLFSVEPRRIARALPSVAARAHADPDDPDDPVDALLAAVATELGTAMRRGEPVSRRARPAKAPLSHEAIVNAALELIWADGDERLTLRRLAAALDTGPASLYVYCKNTDELHAAVLDDLLGTIDSRRGKKPWRARLVGGPATPH